MSLPFLAQATDGVRLRIHAQPNASKNQVVGVHGDSLKVKIKAPPEDGRANDELLDFLSSVLEVPKRSLTLISGHASRAKVVEIRDLDFATAQERILFRTGK